MKNLAAVVVGLASLCSAQAALADEIITYDIRAFLWWHQTQDDGAATSLTGQVTYNYTTNLFTQADVKVGPYQFSMNAPAAPYTNQIVWNSVGIDQTLGCALPAGETCDNGLLSGNFVEFSIEPLSVGPNASDSFTHYGTLPFQFLGKLGTNGPTATGIKDLAWYIGTGTVVAVPEPETYAMLMAGLGLLGFASRRRQASK